MSACPAWPGWRQSTLLAPAVFLQPSQSEHLSPSAEAGSAGAICLASCFSERGFPTQAPNGTLPPSSLLTQSGPPGSPVTPPHPYCRWYTALCAAVVGHRDHKGTLLLGLRELKCLWRTQSAHVNSEGTSFLPGCSPERETAADLDIRYCVPRATALQGRLPQKGSQAQGSH